MRDARNYLIFGARRDILYTRILYTHILYSQNVVQLWCRSRGKGQPTGEALLITPESDGADLVNICLPRGPGGPGGGKQYTVNTNARGLSLPPPPPCDASQIPECSRGEGGVEHWGNTGGPTGTTAMDSTRTGSWGAGTSAQRPGRGSKQFKDAHSSAKN